MIPIEFGIIEGFDENGDYLCSDDKFVCIDDDLYINDWWKRLVLMKTYFHTLDRPAFGLDRWGITIIPPESLKSFQEIVNSDKRIYQDEHLVDLAKLIQKAIIKNKYMIHYGV